MTKRQKIYSIYVTWDFFLAIEKKKLGDDIYFVLSSVSCSFFLMILVRSILIITLSKAFGLRNLCYSKISAVMLLGNRIAGISRKLESERKKYAMYTNAAYFSRMAENGFAPPPREFCRHILSCRELKAESFKRCLHSVLRGVSL